jgi:isoquinoline 1-oxidoreductase alpha subunit
LKPFFFLAVTKSQEHTMELDINGKPYQVPELPNRPLLWVLRDELGLIGTKYGCGIGICGVCAVHVDGVPTRACITLISGLEEKRIRTIEGLATVGADGEVQLHPVQQAFLELQAPQCSWCMSGQMMTAAAMLEENPSPSEDEIKAALNNNYCRCGCYFRVRQAVTRAAEILAEEGSYGRA